MKSKAHDPFGEWAAGIQRRAFHVLGARIDVDADDAGLMAIAAQAFGGLPRHRLTARTPRYRLRLRATLDPRAQNRGQRKQPLLTSGAGLLCCTLDAANYAVVTPGEGAALVAISASMRANPYEVRYDLIEFAILTLVARASGLTPLHAACVGRNGLGVLLLGESGAGKSTLCLRALADGYELLAEDAVFVARHSLRATGLANYLHVRRDARKSLRGIRGVAQILRAPIIRRRSGVHKFEYDLRDGAYLMAPRAQRIGHVVVLSAASAGASSLLRPLSRTERRRALVATQPYAAGLQGWSDFVRRIEQVPAYEMRRGQSADDSLAALRELLGDSPRPLRSART